MPMIYWWAKPYVTGGLRGHGGALAWTREFAAVHYAGHGALAAAKYAKFAKNVHASGHSALSASARMYSTTRSAELSGTGIATAAAGMLEVVAGQGQVTASAFAYFSRGTILSRHGAASATAVACQFRLPATLAGRGTLSATAFGKYLRTVSRTGQGVLLATARNTAVPVAYHSQGTTPANSNKVSSATNYITTSPGDYVIIDMYVTASQVSSLTYAGVNILSNVIGTDGVSIVRWGYRDLVGGTNRAISIGLTGDVYLASQALAYSNVGSVGAAITETGTGTTFTSTPVVLTAGQVAVHIFVNSGNTAASSLSGGTTRYSYGVYQQQDSDVSTTFVVNNPGSVTWYGLTTILSQA